MKILLTCDPEIPVPPIGYGGVERLVDGLAEAYQKQGHDVFLVAHEASNCSFVQKIYLWPVKHSRGSMNVFRNAQFNFSLVTGMGNLME